MPTRCKTEIFISFGVLCKHALHLRTASPMACLNPESQVTGGLLVLLNSATLHRRMFEDSLDILKQRFDAERSPIESLLLGIEPVQQLPVRPHTRGCERHGVIQEEGLRPHSLTDIRHQMVERRSRQIGWQNWASVISVQSNEITEWRPASQAKTRRQRPAELPRCKQNEKAKVGFSSTLSTTAGSRGMHTCNIVTVCAKCILYVHIEDMYVYVVLPSFLLLARLSFRSSLSPFAPFPPSFSFAQRAFSADL